MTKSPIALFAAIAVAIPTLAGVGAVSHAATLPQPTYRANDYADGDVLSVLPPGENGLVNPTQALAFEATGARPANSQDQLGKYANLLYGYPNLTDQSLANYYDDESFGIPPGQITRTEHPSGDVVIYRDTHDVPHIYGTTDAAAAYGAGYAQAEDRLFFMDVLRHYGGGTLSAFLGPSCADEQMDHDELLLAPYPAAVGKAQVDALPKEYGAQGTIARSMIYAYVDGVNAYIAATQTNPSLLPAEYAAALLPPQPWAVGDIVDVAGLVGGIFGNGGGIEVANAALYQYLTKKLGASAGAQAFAELKEQNDPSAPTTVVDKTFPYMTPGKVNPATTALPDDATKPLTGGPTDTTSGCNGVPANPTALAAIASLESMPKHMSNALVVDAKDSASGHPVAVFGPQVSYFAPEILSEEEVSAPGYHAEGASFPGTGIVELGRGEDYAWSATSAGSDLADEKLELVCDPNGTPTADDTYYMFDGKCIPMTKETFTEAAVTKAEGTGTPTVITHDIYLTRHGVVQGWTTAKNGKPVAVVRERTTFGHDVDSIVGFLRWGDPALTYDPQSWMKSATAISYTFNWFYVDSKHVAYYVSGKDPIRPADVNPNLPAWGTGNAEWQGYLAAANHVHEIDPPQGFFVSWNNKPAPGFSAADDQYGYGPVYRSQMLVTQLKHQLTIHHDKLTRSDVAQAMETAASQDLDGLVLVPQLRAYLSGRNEPAGVKAMLAQLSTWYAAGAHRRKVKTSDAQYQYHAAVAIMDELMNNLIEAVWNPLLAAGGLGAQGSTGGAMTPAYRILPMQWVNTPNSGDTHLGSAYDGGFEGYMLKAFEQLRGMNVSDPFTSVITKTWCGSGPTSCHSAIDTALAKTYAALVTANGGSTSVAAWTKSSALVADAKATNDSGETMPEYDAIVLRPVGLIAQPHLDWQNRPTFQQVVEFPRHRPSSAAAASGAGGGQAAGGSQASGALPATGGSPVLPLTAAALLAASLTTLLGIRRFRRVK